MKVIKANPNKNTVEGVIYETGFEKKSQFRYLYEAEKKVFHIYDDLSHNHTSAVNSVGDIIAEIDKIITSEDKGLKKFTQNFVSLFSKNEPSKIIFYTETKMLGRSGTSRYGEPLRIQAYDLQMKDYTGYTKEELHANFVDINSVVVPN
ncbi:hypothetical protein CEY02_19235 [Bacillus pumilus]|uniref:Uncharacterized protein n=1 Tax=Bacillus pumilus TaxID=1408 RepID=A0A2A5IM17_BACPU|nr:hypothetical protein [Bacillus pumilus]PCK18146.1 hypothetical protein CEY02_19235 [Bacillus pumilus]